MKVRTAFLALCAAALVVPAAAGREFSARAPALPEVIESGATIVVVVAVANEGSDSWSSEHGYFLSYHWFDEDKSMLVRDGERSSFQGAVTPRSETEVIAVLQAPEKAGDYFLQWDVVHEGVRWFSEGDGSPTLVPVRVGSTHAVTIEVVDVPARAWAGAQVEVAMTVRNDGLVPWSADGTIAVAYHWLDERGRMVDRDGIRSPISELVVPGESVVLSARLTFPDRPGRYLLQWDMVHEGVCWFSERDTSMPSPYVCVVISGPYIEEAPLVFVLLLLVGAALARISHQSPAAVGDAPCPASFSRLGVLDVQSSTSPRPSGRKHHRARRLADLATNIDEKCELAMMRPERWPRFSGVMAWADLIWLGAVVMLKQWVVISEANLWPGPTAGWAALSGGALLLSVLALLPRRLRIACSYAAGFFTTLVVYGDLVYQRFFGDLLSIAALQSAHQAAQVSASVGSLFRGSDLWLWIDLAPALILMIVIAGFRPVERARRAWLATGLLGVTFATSTWLLCANHPLSKQIFRKVYLAQQIGVLNYHAVDLARVARRTLMAARLSDHRFTEIVDFYRARAPERAGQGPLFGSARGMNLLMIQVESLQAFVLGFEIGGREVTPTLNRWLAGSAYFPEFYDQTGQGRSSDCEVLTQVSLLPAASGAAVFLYPDNAYTGLAGVLGDHGYHTISAVPFDGAFWNRRVMHHAFGYEESLFKEDFAAGEIIGWGLNDRDFLLQMAGRLQNVEQPFCAWLITLSLHHPFAGFPLQHIDLDVAEWEGTPFGNYLHTMHYFDRALADFETALEASGLLETTVIALWGDHDAGFQWGPRVAAAMQTTVDDAGWFRSQRVPLLIRAAAVAGLAGERTIVAGHVDVAPTLIALLGVDPSGFGWLGRNLLGEPGQGVITGEYRCWAGGNLLYLNRGPALAGGDCLGRMTLEALPTDACAQGFADAASQLEVSATVLDFDLQVRVGQVLSGKSMHK